MSSPYAGACCHRVNARNVRRYIPEMKRVLVGIKSDRGTIRPQLKKSVGEGARMSTDAVFLPLRLGYSISAGETGPPCQYGDVNHLLHNLLLQSFKRFTTFAIYPWA